MNYVTKEMTGSQMAGLDLAKKAFKGEFFTMSWRERRRRKEERKRETCSFVCG